MPPTKTRPLGNRAGIQQPHYKSILNRRHGDWRFDSSNNNLFVSFRGVIAQTEYFRVVYSHNCCSACSPHTEFDPVCRSHFVVVVNSIPGAYSLSCAVPRHTMWSMCSLHRLAIGLAKLKSVLTIADNKWEEF